MINLYDFSNRRTEHAGGDRARGAMQKEPLMTLSDARRELEAFRIGERELRTRIENLELPWVWNIASSGTRLRAIRLLPAGVRELRQCLIEGRTPGLQPPLGFAAVRDLVLPPGGQGALTTTEVARILNCGGMHILNLLQQQELTLVPGTAYHAGRTGAARIGRASLESFLRARVLVRHLTAPEV